ncbi:tail fiber domain-containing protein [Candidatus Parabeggiatoa sp. HSG14]|uniref:tail fiber domain-containing protein n=1 Tax=Candidatus Parabeggiatoa sp. HSG14 TaxID=3055593 RepID=UPI0025A7A33C|nr:tail fiber domain-containing protein [Thiotrichales bacterium HSG14]
MYHVSDERWKKAITPLENSLEKVSKLRGVTYKWNTEDYPDMNFDDKTHLGFIAQEVEPVIPELVSTDDEGYKSVSYENVTAVLVEAVKELKTQNDALKAIVCEDHPEKAICQ